MSAHADELLRDAEFADSSIDGRFLGRGVQEGIDYAKIELGWSLFGEMSETYGCRVA